MSIMLDSSNQISVINSSLNPIIATFSVSDPTSGLLTNTVLCDPRTFTDITDEMKLFQGTSTVAFMEVPQTNSSADSVQVVNFQTQYFLINGQVALTNGLSFQLNSDSITVFNLTNVSFNMNFVIDTVSPKTGFTITGTAPAQTATTFDFPNGETINQLVQSISASGTTSTPQEYLNHLRATLKKRKVTPIDKISDKQEKEKEKTKNPFAQKLIDLNEMGFMNRQQNIEALVKAKGDIIEAVTALLE